MFQEVTTNQVGSYSDPEIYHDLPIYPQDVPQIPRIHTRIHTAKAENASNRLPSDSHA